MAQVQNLDPQEKHSVESAEAGPLVRGGDTVGAARAQHAALRHRPNESVCVHYGGRQFITTYEMAGFFLRRAQRLIDAEDAELVPLVYEDGLELLYVSSAMPFSVHDVDAEPADGSHASLADSSANTEAHDSEEL